MKKIERTDFILWVSNMKDANILICLAWFGYGKTWDDCFTYLLKSWDRDEIADAWMRK